MKKNINTIVITTLGLVLVFGFFYFSKIERVKHMGNSAIDFAEEDIDEIEVSETNNVEPEPEPEPEGEEEKPWVDTRPIYYSLDSNEDGLITVPNSMIIEGGEISITSKNNKPLCVFEGNVQNLRLEEKCKGQNTSTHMFSMENVKFSEKEIWSFNHSPNESLIYSQLSLWVINSEKATFSGFMTEGRGILSVNDYYLSDDGDDLYYFMKSVGEDGDGPYPYPVQGFRYGIETREIETIFSHFWKHEDKWVYRDYVIGDNVVIVTISEQVCENGSCSAGDLIKETEYELPAGEIISGS